MLPSQLHPDCLWVMSQKASANCQKWLQLERDSGDMNNHVLSENGPSALLDVLSEITSDCVMLTQRTQWSGLIIQPSLIIMPRGLREHFVLAVIIFAHVHCGAQSAIACQTLAHEGRSR